MKKLNYSELTDMAIRYYVASYLLVYGGAKIMKGQFLYGGEVYEKAVGELSGFELTWVFFGHSYTYAVIIGVIQIIGSLLLLIPRTKLLGAFLLMPVLLNIILIDIFYKIPFGALNNAIFYFVGLMVVLILNREKVLGILSLLIGKVKLSFQLKAIAIRTMAIVAGFLVLFVLNMVTGHFLKYLF